MLYQTLALVSKRLGIVKSVGGGLPADRQKIPKARLAPTTAKMWKRVALGMTISYNGVCSLTTNPVNHAFQKHGVE